MDKINYSKENKKKNDKFKKKNVKHSPKDESARAVFGAPEEKNLD